MKYKTTYLLSILITFFTSCELDNYDEPESTLTGNIIYNGQNIGVKGSGGSVKLELWQPGYELSSAINVFVAQDGSFQAKLFDGTYKLVSKNGTGPWVSAQDTVKIEVSGNTVCEYPVTPYYTVSVQSLSLSGSTLTATFTITSVDGSLPIDRAMLVVNNTAFVDETAEVAREDLLTATTGQNTITMELDDSVLSHSSLNARIGVKTEGNEAIYSPITQIK